MTDCELIGVGSPLVDLLLEVDDAFLEKHVEGAKGGMELVDDVAIAEVLKSQRKKPLQAPGGAAANTTVGCAQLGIKCAFIGSCGDDDYATYFREALAEHHCEARLVAQPDQHTGHVLSLVTPDAERTMRTTLGAAGMLEPSQFSAETFAGAKVVMLEGYTLFNPELTRAIANAAKDAGCKLALDMASFEVVQANHAILDDLLKNRVDIVFANEDEAAAWHSDGIEAAIYDLAKHCEVAVVKLGKEGAWICQGEERHHVDAQLVEALDTTGAGDTWAAGFLAGYIRGLPLDVCGNVGAMASAAVVQVLGAQVPQDAWQPIQGYLDAYVSVQND